MTLIDSSHLLAFLSGSLFATGLIAWFWTRHRYHLQILFENKLTAEWKKGFEAGCKKAFEPTPNAP
jgi:hypothetical protein